jgi:hypothetical protein
VVTDAGTSVPDSSHRAFAHKLLQRLHRRSRVVGSDARIRLVKAASAAVPLNGKDSTQLGQDAHQVTQFVLHSTDVIHPCTDSHSNCQADATQVGEGSNVRANLDAELTGPLGERVSPQSQLPTKDMFVQAAERAPGVAIGGSEEGDVPPARGRKVGALSPTCEGKLSLSDDANEADLGDSAKPKAKPQSRTSNKVRMRVPDVRKRTTAVNQDWMFDSDEFSFWEGKTRPFTLDACADNEGTNSQCAEKFNCPNRSFLKSDCTGQHVWLNPPYVGATAFLKHFEQCRSMSPSTTSAVIVLPAWVKPDWRPYLSKYKLLHTYPTGRDALFTTPHPVNADERISVGPTRFPVNVWFADYADPQEEDRGNQEGAGSSGRSSIATALQTAVRGELVAEEQPSYEQRAVTSSVINLTTQQSDNNLIYVGAMVAGHDVDCLIDSGASRNFMDAAYAKAKGLVPRGPISKVRVANGSIIKTVGEVECNVAFDRYGMLPHECTVRFTVLPLVDQAVILGYPFLQDQNPLIDWQECLLEFNHAQAHVHVPVRVASRPCRVENLDARKFAKLMHKNVKREKDHQSSFFYGSLRKLHEEVCDALNKVGDVPTSAGNLKPKETGPPPTKSEQIKSVQSDLGPAWTSLLHDLLHKHETVLDKPSGIPPSRGIGDEMRIHLVPGAEPPRPKVYRMSPAELADLKEQIEGYLKKGFIRTSHSSWAAPVLFARKPDGSLRMCIDYRGLDALTVKDRYPIPRIDDLLDILAGSSVYTLLDMAQGFHQIRINEDDVHKSAFNTRYGQFEWVVMPFGLTNCPAMLQRVMNRIFEGYIDVFVMIYMDDVLIFSKDADEHLKHLDKVLERLAQFEFKVRLDKCFWGKLELEFLGHLLSGRGIAPSPAKVKVVAEWQRPKNLDELRVFLGFTNYYRKFVHRFSKIALPLNKLTKKGVDYKWTPECEEAFRTLRSALTLSPVLILPKTCPTTRFVVSTDSSGFAVSGILLQDQGNGLQPIEYYAKSMNAAEVRYPVHEQELFAVVSALRHWRHYLDGCECFLVATDHDTLKHFMTQKEMSKRQAGWLEVISPFANNMDIFYRKGETNLADGLSRRPDLKLSIEQLQEYEANSDT